MLRLRTPLRRIEGDIAFDLTKMRKQRHDADQHRDRARQPRTGNAERMARAQARDQNRRQRDVDGHRKRLHQHRGTHDAGSAQRGSHHLARELQRERRHEPQQIRGPRLDRGFVRGDRMHVGARQRRACDQGQQSEQHRQHDRLIEDQIGIRPILASHGMRDQRHRADAEHLHQRVDEKAGIAGRRHARDRGIAQARDEVQIDQLAKHDRDHTDHDRRCHAQNVLRDGAVGQVFHFTHP